MAKNQAATNKVDIFIPIYIGDYLKDTSCLTTEEHGAYLLLIFYYWQHGSIPDDDGKLCRITGLYPDAWSNAKSTLLAYFVQGVNCYRHTRIDNELSKAKSRKEANIARAKTAAGKRWSGKKDASSNAPSNATSTRQAMLEQCPSPSPSPSTVTTKAKSKKDLCPEPQSDYVPEDSVMVFPTTGNPKEWHLTDSKLNEWQETYDTIDVQAQSKQALQWIKDNPTRRKTARGMTKFLGGWFNRAVQRGETKSQKSKTDKLFEGIV